MQDSKSFQFIGDLTSDYARDKSKHEEIRNDFRKSLEQQLPLMIDRLSEIGTILIPEGKEFSDLLTEAKSAYVMGYWRAVVALIGVAGESFTDSLCRTIDSGKNIPAKEKIAALLSCNKIEAHISDRLLTIKRLRNSCVHPKKMQNDMHPEAKEALNAFIEIMDWHTNKTLGKIKITPGMQ